MQKKFRISWRSIRGEWNAKNYIRLIVYIASAFLINLAVEMLSRRSAVDGLAYLAERPWQFFYDTLIILFSLCISMLFRKRGFFFFLISALWLGLGVTNCILLGYRATPLTAPDIWLMASVRDIMEVYLPPLAITALIVGIAVVIAGIALIWLSARKYQVSYFFSVFHALLIGCILLIITVLFINNGTIDSEFPNLPDAYDDNGFAYCFSASAITQGIDEPEGYTEEVIDSIIQGQEDLPASRKNTPNIIFVQLESFFDVNYLKEFTYAENPVPNFQRLKQTCSTGLFYVPSIGAGTANTEFEVLSGMNLDHFGVGEYPYKTVVKRRVCDSLAYALQDFGYSTHAIHNNNATFYSRDRVYANFGFDTFTSLEYMNDVQYNALGWAEDVCLTDEILKAMQSSEGKDFVFTVSVQPHGKYPTEPLENAPIIAVDGMADEARQNGFEYYLAQIKETDRFIGELTQALSEFDEPAVVVFYGDHLPSFNITQEELSRGTIQSTEYLIWANFHLVRKYQDVQAYQLAALVLDRVGIHEGAIFRYQQSNSDLATDSDEYQKNLCLLEYDMLYGEQWYSDELRETVDMRLGVENIVITGVENLTDLIVNGENFTPSSVILLNGEQIETEFLSETTLRAADILLNEGDTVEVAQVSTTDSLHILSQTGAWVFGGES